MIGSVYIANNMDPDQTAHIVFASMIKRSLKCIWRYAADVNIRGHYQDNKILGGFIDNKLLSVCMFSLQNCRKVVVATNIAETSITISGIRHVIDSGMVKAK